MRVLDLVTGVGAVLGFLLCIAVIGGQWRRTVRDGRRPRPGLLFVMFVLLLMDLVVLVSVVASPSGLRGPVYGSATGVLVAAIGALAVLRPRAVTHDGLPVPTGLVRGLGIGAVLLGLIAVVFEVAAAVS